MNTFRVSRHPLDRFSLTGSLGNLDCKGRAAADHLMALISDMRFRKESLWGFVLAISYSSIFHGSRTFAFRQK
jgi:hypothetical protein